MECSIADFAACDRAARPRHPQNFWTAPHPGLNRVQMGTGVPCPLCLRLWCKSLFALVIKIFPGCGRDFQVKMWGTSSPDDKLTGDLGNVIESTKIGGRRSDRLVAGKLSPGHFGLLQQYPH